MLEKRVQLNSTRYLTEPHVLVVEALLLALAVLRAWVKRATTTTQVLLSPFAWLLFVPTFTAL